MQRLPSGITRKIDQDTGEIFYDVEVKNNGKIIAKEADFSDMKEALNYLYKHKDRQNIQKFTLKSTGFVKYKAEFYLGSETTPKRKIFETFNEAVLWRRQCREGGVSDDPKDKSKMSLTNFSAYWLENEVKVSRSDNTYETYERCLRLYVWPSIGKKKLAEIKKTDMNELVTFMKKENKRLKKRISSARTINLTIAVVGRIYNYALDNDILEANPISRYKKQKPPLKAILFWLDDDIKRFCISSMGHWAYPIFFAALRTGMRKGELLGLKWDVVDFSQNKVNVIRNRTQKKLQETTKQKKGRFIPMASDLREMLRSEFIKRGEPRDGFVFLNKNHQPINYESINITFKELQRAAGVSSIIKFHDLRHTFASQFVLKGGDSNRLKIFMGHSDLKMTEHYTHLDDKHLNEGLEFIEKLELQ